jgi:hypothetical protein
VENPSNSARPVTREIELVLPDGRTKRLWVTHDTSRLCIPHAIAGQPGIGSVAYIDSGLRTEDGAELWTSDWRMH